MGHKKYSISDCLKSLKRKNDCQISIGEQTIYILHGNLAKNDLGNGSWGKIDFLTHYCGFDKIFVERYPQIPYL